MPEINLYARCKLRVGLINDRTDLWSTVYRVSSPGMSSHNAQLTFSGDEIPIRIIPVCCHLPKTNIALSNSFPSSSRLNSNWTPYIHSTPFGILCCESERYSRRTVSKHVDPVFVIGNCREE